MKDVSVLVPCMFSVGAANHLLKIASEENLGRALEFVWISDWDWYLLCEDGRVIVKDMQRHSSGHVIKEP